ncbi:protein of unknown function [Cyanobium sp. NIES-981]|nr:protein of unknown function [Cyanobium sp. NIES-981]
MRMELNFFAMLLTMSTPSQMFPLLT